jgi:hypothetical protein
MIHVLTVHWLDDRWIEPQLRHLRRTVTDFRTYASLNGIDPSFDASFDVARDLEGNHPSKLEELARIASADADPDDLLLFLDGDAFPIAPVDASLLDGYPLVAVRRDENLGQQQPHPSFCMTTVRFWNEIGGTWKRGYTWTASNGAEVTDAGGELLGILRAQGIEWRPLLRSNRVELDPLWFAIYGDVVYHHGAGFRPPVSTLQTHPAIEAMRERARRTRVPASVPLLSSVERSLRFRLAQRRMKRELAEGADEHRALSDEVFEWILTDDEFYRRFLEAA